MTEEQQAWFYCLVSKKWCVVNNADKAAREEKLVAMISANKPAYFQGNVARVTLQVTCADGKPVTMLMSGREISEPGEITLNYQINPSGKSGLITAKQAGDGHFFEIKDQSFLKDWGDGTKATVRLNFPSDPKPSTLEYDLTGTEAALKRLSCF